MCCRLANGVHNNFIIDSATRPSDPESTGHGFESYICCRVEHWASLFSYMKEYLTRDSGGYFRANRLRALIAAWLNASQIVQHVIVK